MKRSHLLGAAAFALVVIVSYSLLAFALHLRKDALDSANHQTCLAIRNINVILTQQLHRSQQNIPKLAYFRHHPAEMRQQLSEIDRQLAAFQPRECR